MKTLINLRPKTTQYYQYILQDKYPYYHKTEFKLELLQVLSLGRVRPYVRERSQLAKHAHVVRKQLGQLQQQLLGKED